VKTYKTQQGSDEEGFAEVSFVCAAVLNMTVLLGQGRSTQPDFSTTRLSSMMEVSPLRFCKVSQK